MTEIIYTEPQLCNYDGDLSKPWFVYFDVTDPNTGVTIRKQFRGGINHIKSREERTLEGNALRKFWKLKLEQGLYNPFVKDTLQVVEIPKDVPAAVKKVIDLKRTSLKNKSIRNYNDVSNMFIRWLTARGLAKIKLYQFNSTHAQAYLDYLLIERKYSGKSHNNQLGILKIIFNQMKAPGRKWVEENPFHGIAELPEELGKNLAYTEREIKILTEHFKQHDKRMYYAINFTFHCFIRKSELVTIRVGDIDWENLTIKLNSADTKNRMQDSVTITDGLHKVLLEMGLDLAPKHYFIFGKGMETCEQQCKRPDDISDRHKRGKDALGFKEDGKAFYSWKHTGVIAYWKQVKDIYYMMRQLRHHDMKVTMVYMKSLGLMPNEAFRAAKIEI